MNNLKKQIKQINAARAQYNPLRSLTIQKVVSLLEQGELGVYRDLQWTYRMIEKRDAVLRALVRRRAAALLKLEWDIKQVPEDDLPVGSTEAQSEAQATALRELYDNIKNIKDAIKALALAEFRGYTMLEKAWKDTTSTNPLQIDALNYIKPWFWCRDGLEGEWKFDPELRGSHASGEPVDPRVLILREVEDPIDEIALIAFIRKNMSQKDWDGFVEVFGIPDIFFIMPPGLTKEQQDEWLVEAEQVAGDGRGAIPNGGDVKTVGGDVRGVNPFEAHLNYQDTMMVLAGTGGKLTMLSEATGIGGGATDAHDDAFDDLAEAEAAAISELFQRNLDLPLLNVKFPGQPVLAYFQLAAEDAEDTAALADTVLKLSQAGLQADADDIAERTGIPLTRAAAPPSGGEALGIRPEALGPEPGAEDPSLKNRGFFSRLFNREAQSLEPKVQSLQRNARSAIASAIALDLRPVAASLADLLDETADADLAEALQAWRTATLPDLAAQTLEDPSAATAYADALSASLLNGFLTSET